MFANLSYQDKEAFFSLLDEYFASRPHLLSSASSPPTSPPPNISSNGNGGFNLNNISMGSINRFISPGPSTPPAASPTSVKSEKELERERKDKQKESERMDLVMKLGKGAIRGSTAASRASLNMVTKSDKAMKALDSRGAGGIVRGANSLAKSADGYLKGPPKGGKEVVVEETTVVATEAPVPPEKKKGGVSGLISGKSFGHVDTGSKMSAFTSMWKDPQKVQPPTVEHAQAPALGGQKHTPLPPPSRRTAPAAEPEQEVGGAESQAQAIYDYTGADTGDLSVQSGQIVNVLEKTSADWWTCEDGNGTRGLVPANYLKEV